jgi:hypothetical protein
MALGDTRWEYATMAAAMVPVHNQLELAVLQVNGHIWDYEREPIAPDDLLNVMGAEAWELVSVLALGQTDGCGRHGLEIHVQAAEHCT